MRPSSTVSAPAGRLPRVLLPRATYMSCRGAGYRLAVRQAHGLVARQADDPLVAGRYRLCELLGRGGMGEVYRASDEVLGRQVAIKLMLPVPQSFAASERFLREARAAARILSPHVVAAY